MVSAEARLKNIKFSFRFEQMDFMEIKVSNFFPEMFVLFMILILVC